jgi:hypothetical protein
MPTPPFFHAQPSTPAGRHLVISPAALKFQLLTSIMPATSKLLGKLFQHFTLYFAFRALLATRAARCTPRASNTLISYHCTAFFPIFYLMLSKRRFTAVSYRSGSHVDDHFAFHERLT